MLSYRHSFHAGNFADVIKHIVVVEILQHLTLKDKPFDYIDTHAGAGLFNLHSPNAKKLEEHGEGIGKLYSSQNSKLNHYLDVIRKYNSGTSLDFYPGSPSIAENFLRPQDKAWLFELHSRDIDLLKSNMPKRKQINILHKDGFKGLLALLPPRSRRGLILIDPPYEIKTDYDNAYSTIIKAYKKFSSGIYALWYPVVDREKIIALEKKFRTSGINNIQRFELGLKPDSIERGMTASGMIVINPPWTLMDKMLGLLPEITSILGSEEKGSSYKCDTIVKE